LGDRCLFRFGRHQAPVLGLSRGLRPQEAVFILFGSFPNRRGTPVLSRWVSVVFVDHQFSAIEPFTETLARTALGQEPIPNPGGIETADLLPLRSPAIEAAQNYLRQERATFDGALSTQLQEQKARMDQLQGQHLEQLTLRFDGDNRPDPARQQRRQGELSRIEKIFKDYRDWVNLSMTTEPEPFIKLVAVL